MTESNKDNEYQSLFVQLVLMFSASAMHALGKTVNPVTKKIERDLNQAKMMIDLLDMIKIKTEGNLDANEKKLLEDTLANLRLNYVEEANKPEKDEPEQDSKERTVDSDNNKEDEVKVSEEKK